VAAADAFAMRALRSGMVLPLPKMRLHRVATAAASRASLASPMSEVSTAAFSRSPTPDRGWFGQAAPNFTTAGNLTAKVQIVIVIVIVFTFIFTFMFVLTAGQ
jgi:hypothetical protein